jgi:hypothetical protein
VSKINETIARLDREARKLGLDLVERGVNRRGFEYQPTSRWMEFRPGGKGIVEVTAYTRRGGLVEAVAHKDVNQMIRLMSRAREE